MRVSSHLAQKQVASFQHQTYVGIYIGRKMSKIDNFSDNML